MKNRLCLALCSLAFFAACSAPRFALEPTWGQLEPDGDIALTDSGNAVARNSLSDLGLDDGESSVGVRADLEFGSPHLTLATQSADWSGSGQVTGNFGGFGGAVAVDSSLDLAVHRGRITFDLVPVPVVELGIGLGVDVLDIEAKVTEQANPNNFEEIDEVLPVPVIALRGGVQVWRLDFEALVAGMAASFSGDKAAYFDYDVAARFRLGGLGPVEAYFTAGYRRIDVDVEYEDSGDDVKADFTVDGLYVGLRASI